MTSHGFQLWFLKLNGKDGDDEKDRPPVVVPDESPSEEPEVNHKEGASSDIGRVTRAILSIDRVSLR